MFGEEIMHRNGARIMRFQYLLLLTIVAILFLAGCGGGGGGAGAGNSTTTSTPSATVTNFSAALKTNNEAAATAIFAEGTKEKSLRIWRTLSVDEKTFIARAIEDSVTVPSISDNQTRLDLFVTVRDAAGVTERIPLVLVKDVNGNWRIRTW